jgi:hypothetical protein
MKRSRIKKKRIVGAQPTCNQSLVINTYYMMGCETDYEMDGAEGIL